MAFGSGFVRGRPSRGARQQPIADLASRFGGLGQFGGIGQFGGARDLLGSVGLSGPPGQIGRGFGGRPSRRRGFSGGFGGGRPLNPAFARQLSQGRRRPFRRGGLGGLARQVGGLGQFGGVPGLSGLPNFSGNFQLPQFLDPGATFGEVGGTLF